MRLDDVAAPRAVRLSDYRPPAFAIDEARFDINLDPARTVVRSRLSLRRTDAAATQAPLVLDGEALELISVSINDAALSTNDYVVDERTLTINGVPDTFILEIETACAPEKNTALSGLYMSKGMFCTQCEAEGFRRITYFLDRPDVLTRYVVRMTADKAAYPVLLANGNPVASGDFGGGRHFAEWSDPHPKPAYLFALVAGDLACVEDRFTSRSGRNVALRVFVQRENADKCAYTLDSLKRAMRWDEDVFGREYDLDIFMIVAVDHFNFGAMENKGLNIFNSAYVLASPETATDQDYENIESIVAHEYFHNWSGNRVTLRDWFQLCLKEGFTVFRDQEFSADMRSRAVQRIKDVRRLWASQFPEDSGPLAHPPRPDEYITIDNFYTATVYEKGAELARMLKALLGPDDFRRACDLYFDRHDGEAATVEDFVRAMEDASGRDLTQFRLWYTRAGTPAVAVSTTHDAERGETRVSLRQSPPPADKRGGEPRHIPLAWSLLDPGTGAVLSEGVYELTGTDGDFTASVEGDAHAPVLSVNRGFAAPVTIERAGDPLADDLAILKHEPDLFSRWAVADRQWKRLCLGLAGAADLPHPDSALADFAEALTGALGDAEADPAFAAELLRPPSVAELAQAAAVIDPAALTAARRRAAATIADALSGRLVDLRDRLHDNTSFSPDAASAGRRALRNAALGLLVGAGRPELAADQAASAANMTDEAAALAALAGSTAPQRDPALDAFYRKWRGRPLLENKWLGWRALRPAPDGLQSIRELLDHEAFDIGNPNKVRALLGVFAHANLDVFHDPGGAGYEFFTDQVACIDALNPQLAARLISAFEPWRRLEPGRRALAGAALDALGDKKNLSDNLYEMAMRLRAG